MDIEQGDIFYVDIPQQETRGSEQYDPRPYVVVSRTALNRILRTVVAVPLTSSKNAKDQPAYRIRVPVASIIANPAERFPFVDSIAKCDMIRVLDKSRLARKLGKLSKAAAAGVELGVAFVMDIRCQ